MPVPLADCLSGNTASQPKPVEWNVRLSQTYAAGGNSIDTAYTSQNVNHAASLTGIDLENIRNANWEVDPIVRIGVASGRGSIQSVDDVSMPLEGKVDDQRTLATTQMAGLNLSLGISRKWRLIPDVLNLRTNFLAGVGLTRYTFDLTPRGKMVFGSTCPEFMQIFNKNSDSKEIAGCPLEQSLGLYTSKHVGIGVELDNNIVTGGLHLDYTFFDKGDGLSSVFVPDGLLKLKLDIGFLF